MPTEASLPQRIVIHGCSGSGKSTLARQLGQRAGLPVIELDALFHQPGWTELPVAEFQDRVTAALAAAERTTGGWIVDGNYDSALDGLVRRRATLVLWFDLPRVRVMARMVRRTLTRTLTHAELWNGNRERWRDVLAWDPKRSIIRWAWTRHHVYRDRLRSASLDHPRDQRWIRIGNQRDVGRVLSEFPC